jgi:hypothetical protein
MAGRSWSQTLAVGAAVLCGVQVVAACNAVLGIEPAELAEGQSSLQCNIPEPNPASECSGCNEVCVSNCGVGDCLKDYECRKKLFAYRGCVGTACTDANGGCACILSDKGDTAAQAAAAAQVTKVASCLKNCGPSCGIAAANTLCEGYCACMHERCSENEPNGAAPGGCLEACMHGLAGQPPPGGSLALNDPSVAAMWQEAPSPEQVGCLWYHCVAVQGDVFNDHHHCDHAIGAVGLCDNPPKPDPHAGLCPSAQRRAQAPCNLDSECCSGHCSEPGVCD